MARSSSLSPLLAAFHLREVDTHVANQQNLDYACYMDDFFIITNTRRQFRRAVRKLNQFFDQYGFRQHPDKTFISPTRKGIDWMGYWLTYLGVQFVAPRALANHMTKLHWLYEQNRHRPDKQQQARVVRYARRWLRWFCCKSSAYGGLLLRPYFSPPVSSRSIKSKN
ncbi:reverse transcriptase domain-containing protein [Budvicia aquatica]|uniref:reverse transcriptase domain-containing protein n=1 Tax=Budvicia aquatica TaxID=82979 RepID=UPI002100AEA0|nr:reverse transcriptase domain-containing protein [Budvicia aquatica]